VCVSQAILLSSAYFFQKSTICDEWPLNRDESYAAQQHKYLPTI